MKFGDMKINMIQFYNLGMICFGVIALANSFNLFHSWVLITFWSKVSAMSSVILNIGLVGFFNYLKSTAPKQADEDKVPKEIDFDELIDNF
jgi:hypothetical protein